MSLGIVEGVILLNGCQTILKHKGCIMKKITQLSKNKSFSQKAKSTLRSNKKEYRNNILNDGFLKGDNYYAMDSMFTADSFDVRIAL